MLVMKCIYGVIQWLLNVFRKAILQIKSTDDVSKTVELMILLLSVILSIYFITMADNCSRVLFNTYSPVFHGSISLRSTHGIILKSLVLNSIIHLNGLCWAFC